MGRLQSVQNAIRFAQEQIMAQSYLDRQLKNSVSEDELLAMYDAEVAKYKPVPEVRAKHILVQTEKEARDIATKLKAGDSFEMLAGKYSLDKSAMDGDLGYFTEDMMVPEFGKVVFKMKKGQISEPIKTPFGWHIVQVDDVRMSKPLSFEEVRNDLRQIVMERNLENVLTEERSKMKVQIKKTAL
jgi:peptidyl-prolyl cis-trans isomerase C